METHMHLLSTLCKYIILPIYTTKINIYFHKQNDKTNKMILISGKTCLLLAL